MRRAAIPAAMAMACALLCAVEESEPERPRGPAVEVTPIDGKTFICHLISMKDGRLSYEMLRGEKRTSMVSDVQRIRFLPPEQQPGPVPPMPGAPHDPQETPRHEGPIQPEEQPDEKRPPMDDPQEDPEQKKHWMLGDTLRMRHLAEKERNGELTLHEVEEIKQLRARAPGLLRPGRLRQAEDNARIEAGKGRLNSYIASQQKRLKEAASDEEARDALAMLAAAYRHNELPPKAISEQLRKDVEAMDHEAVRGKLADRVPDLLEQFRSMRKFGK
jgi:hypothetical protein